MERGRFWEREELREGGVSEGGYGQEKGTKEGFSGLKRERRGCGKGTKSKKRKTRGEALDRGNQELREIWEGQENRRKATG